MLAVHPARNLCGQKGLEILQKRRPSRNLQGGHLIDDMVEDLTAFAKNIIQDFHVCYNKGHDWISR